jgi:hypothetical protein
MNNTGKFATSLLPGMGKFFFSYDLPRRDKQPFLLGITAPQAD